MILCLSTKGCHRISKFEGEPSEIFRNVQKQVFYNVSWLCFIASIRWRGIKKICGNLFRQFSDEENKKKSKQIGQEKVALTITGAGVVARKLTFSNNISELLDSAPPAPRWLFAYITVTSHVAGLSRTLIVRASWVYRTGSDTVKQSQRRVTSPTSKMFWQR